jgi:hypothetical protein
MEEKVNKCELPYIEYVTCSRNVCGINLVIVFSIQSSFPFKLVRRDVYLKFIESCSA